MQPLPIDPLLPEVVSSLCERPALVLEAPPGAGKTTRVPRALLGAPWCSGQIVVLEPRRLATRIAARRVAGELGDRLGATVGYQVRFEDVSSARTRIRFVTEGILGRQLLESPALEGVSAVVLDEFHERHLQGDVALAMLERLRRSRRPDLRIVVMSATLATAPVAQYLDAPVLRAEGRLFEVVVDHLPSPDERPLGLQVASAVRRLVHEGLDGDVLVFLPGAGEIRKTRQACERVAQDADLLIVPLHGDLDAEQQDAALRPASKRKIILSTNVAESSVTIEGVVAVIDSGLARVASQSPWSGFSRLRVEKISRASAVQRSGRAGRMRPGRCVRLYTRADFELRPAFAPPEILRLDLAEMQLELAAAGATDVEWLEAPPPSHVRAAEELLRRLQAVDAEGRPTETGRAMLRFGVHPRAARVVVEGERRGMARDACLAAAILSEGDPRATSRAGLGERRPSEPRAEDRATERSDVLALVDLFREVEDAGFSDGSLRAAGLDRGAIRAIARATSQLERACARRSDFERPGAGPLPYASRADGRSQTSRPAATDREVALQMALLAGYPDRVAKRVRNGGRQLALASGGSAELSGSSVVRDAEWLIALDAEEQSDARSRGGVLVRLASAIDPDWLIDLFPGDVSEARDVTWDAGSERVFTRESLRWGALTLVASEPTTAPSPEASRLLAEAARAAGLAAFAPADALELWIARVRFAASIDASIQAPDEVELASMLVELSEGKTSFAELREAGILETLRHSKGPPQGVLDRLAPQRVVLTGGRSVAVRYEHGKPPSIASRLQDFFGMVEGPYVGGGRVPLVLELLAPNGRAVQVTTDLAGFWGRHYPAIRKELMRRYPRHSWPEDPRVPTPRMRPR